MHSICFRHVTKRFGDLVATNDLTFSVEAGEIFGILGPNGAGKTTIINQIMGLISPDGGEVLVHGLQPEKHWREVRRLVGLVPQETALYPELSARMNLRFHAALYLDSMRHADARINQVLDLVDLPKRADDPVRTFSGGMKRRLAIGRALLNEPAMLVLDEPTLGVDVQGTHTIWQYVRRLADGGKTVLLTTNVMSEADYLCDRVLIIDRGAHVVAGSPEDLKRRLGQREIVVAFDADDAAAALRGTIPLESRQQGSTLTITAPHGAEDLVAVTRALSDSSQVNSIELKKPRLDDVFLHFTGRSLRD